MLPRIMETHYVADFRVWVRFRNGELPYIRAIAGTGGSSFVRLGWFGAARRPPANKARAKTIVR